MAYGGSGPHYYGLTGEYSKPKEDFIATNRVCGFPPVITIVAILLLIIMVI